MKKLISFNYVATLVLAFGIMVAFDSCTEDPCKDVTCVNGSTVTVGDLCTCDCDPGYSGANCTIEDLCVINDVNCLNGGVCVDGDCECAAGYEGDSCETLTRAKFNGSWGVVDDCSQSGTASYTVGIASSPTAVEQVLISNFWGVFVNDVVATVSGNEITIASQEPDGDDYFVSGSGTLTGTTITITYNIEDRTGTPTVTDVCTNSTWVK